MAAVINRCTRQTVLKVKNVHSIQQANLGTGSSKGKKIALTLLGVAGATGACTAYVAYRGAVHAGGGLHMHPPILPWPSKGLFSDFDKRSLKRGYEVFKNVCSSCHSLQYVTFREMIGVIFSVEEAKKEAADYQILDGPDAEGHMYRRPGLIIDSFPNPYDNIQAAKAANNGAAPPDLTYYVKVDETGPNYIFALLTGYVDPPAGLEMAEGVHYNPYYTGGLIAMAKALYDDIIEYEDGTPATTSQLAKDVVTFLMWASEPEFEVRKRGALKLTISLTIMGLAAYYWKRMKWSTLKSNIHVLRKVRDATKQVPKN